MMNVVRSLMGFSIAACTSRSDSLSSDDVASSSMRMGAFFRTARAIVKR